MAEETLTTHEEFDCHLCGNRFHQPRVLSCLHTFCGDCLEQKIQENDDEERCISADGQLLCPTCHQGTKLGNRGVFDLPKDHIIMTMMDMIDIQSQQIMCTSCKTHEKAVARCCNCSYFLCDGCVQAHRNMRCFDNHKVVILKDLKSNDWSTFHHMRPCSTHTDESLNFYCHHCQVPICNECMVNDHKTPPHQCVRIKDAEPQQRYDLDMLMAQCKSKIMHCEEEMSKLNTNLTELQLQKDVARKSIDETFQTYKNMLENKKDSLMRTLDDQHSKQEVAVMELSHSIESLVEKMEDACKFTERLLHCGSGVDIVSMRKMCATQLWLLSQDTPKIDTDFGLQFITQEPAFEKAVDRFFGIIVSRIYEKQESEGSNLSSAEHEGLMMSSLETVSPPLIDTVTVSSMAGSPILGVPIAYVSNVGSHMTSMADGKAHISPALSDRSISLDAASRNGSASSAATGCAVDVNRAALLNAASGRMVTTGSRFPIAKINNSALMNTLVARPPLFDSTQATMMSAGALIEPTVVSAGLAPMALAVPGFVKQQLALNSSQQLSVTANGAAMSLPYPARTATSKIQPMQIKCKFGQQGPVSGQFNSPHGFCLGLDEDIVVADTMNHRIQIFSKNGEYRTQFGIPGKEEGQLWYPRKVTVMRNSGKFVVCDRGNERSRMQLFLRTGNFVRRIAIRYIDIVAGLAVSPSGHIVAVDSVTPTVFCISESGDLIRWFDCSDYMREPSDIAVNGNEYFVCDFKGHCVVVFSDQGVFLRRIGCEQVTSFPNGIDISTAGDVLVGDSHGNRFHVAVFQRDGSLLSEFECPHVKVSRCCGLKITSEGYVVTLAKNNHYVLVLNTLYINNN